MSIHEIAAAQALTTCFALPRHPLSPSSRAWALAMRLSAAYSQCLACEARDGRNGLLAGWIDDLSQKRPHVEEAWCVCLKVKEVELGIDLFL